MSSAQFIPIFVTASVPVEVIDLVLENAIKEDRDSEGLFPNCWVLVQHPTQRTFSKPTQPPVSAFETGFRNASVDELERFVEADFGEGRLGHGSEFFDYIADDAFGVIDERTSKDGTISLLARELVNSIEEAQVRVAWHKGSKRDKALVRYYDNREISDEEIESLARDINGVDADTSNKQEPRKQLWELVQQAEKSSTEKWFEFRLNSTTAVSDVIGIFHRGVVYSLLNREDEFDENGVMIGELDDEASE